MLFDDILHAQDIQGASARVALDVVGEVRIARHDGVQALQCAVFQVRTGSAYRTSDGLEIRDAGFFIAPMAP